MTFNRLKRREFIEFSLVASGRINELVRTVLR